MVYEQSTQQRVSSNFWYGIYGLMATGLMLTAATAYLVSLYPAFYMTLFKTPMLFALLVLAQFALVIGLSMFIMRLSFPVAMGLFYVYAISLGITLSAIFLAYTQTSLFITFLITGGMFGSMALYGYVTKSDLSNVGSVVTMALFGLIIAMLVNLFFQSKTFDWIISGIGVLIFTVLTAYDTQKIKRIANQLLVSEGAPIGQVMVIGALTLYLDFINLFLFLLRFTGTRREE